MKEKKLKFWDFIFVKLDCFKSDFVNEIEIIEFESVLQFFGLLSSFSLVFHSLCAWIRLIISLLCSTLSQVTSEIFQRVFFSFQVAVTKQQVF